MTEMYIITMLLTALIGIIFVYNLYCLIDLFLFRLKVIATTGHGTTKHINIYRFILRLNGGTGPGRVPDTLFRIGMALKINSVLTAVTLILTIIMIGVTATLSVFNTATAAVIRNNHAIIQQRQEDSSEDSSDWVDEKDDDRHGETSSTDNSSSSSNESSSSQSTTSEDSSNWVDDKDNNRHGT